jgi:hypothetical protein
MNSTDKKRVEQMLRDRSRKAMGLDVYGHQTQFPPEIKPSKGQQTRLDSAFKALKPTKAAFDRCEKIVKEIQDEGFSVDWERKHAERSSASAPITRVSEDNRIYKAQQDARRLRTIAVSEATDVAIIALWSDAEFDIAVYFERIDSA